MYLLSYLLRKQKFKLSQTEKNHLNCEQKKQIMPELVFAHQNHHHRTRGPSH